MIEFRLLNFLFFQEKYANKLRLFILISLIYFNPIFAQSIFDLKTKPIYIHAESVDDIREFRLDSIPPYIYTKIPDLTKLSVKQRKEKFIELILPSILFAKSQIVQVLHNIDNIPLGEIYNYCRCQSKNKILQCLSNQPNSIILAQAAIESGWGTSRFFQKGYNLFGVHSYNSKDERIQANGQNVSPPVYVKKYNNILHSISDYLRNLATHKSYEEYRIHRCENKNVSELLQYLTMYSERRELYIDDLEDIINYNNFFIYDTIKVTWK